MKIKIAKPVEPAGGQGERRIRAVACRSFNTHLSRRVHDLKREEGGYGEMCEISEKIYKEGVEEGIEKGIEQGIEKGIEQGIEKGIEQGKQETLRKTAETMDRMGMPVETIAQALEVSEETVRAWLEA